MTATAKPMNDAFASSAMALQCRLATKHIEEFQEKCRKLDMLDRIDFWKYHGQSWLIFLPDEPITEFSTDELKAMARKHKCSCHNKRGTCDIAYPDLKQHDERRRKLREQPKKRRKRKAT